MLTSVSAALVWAEAISWLGFYKKLQAIWIWLVICFFMTILSFYLSNVVCVSVCVFYSLSNYVSGLGLEQYYIIIHPQFNILLRPHCVIKQLWEQDIQNSKCQSAGCQKSHRATQSKHNTTINLHHVTIHKSVCYFLCWKHASAAGRWRHALTTSSNDW